jgi:predicted DNA-binding transcriptional regulator AlpA
MSSNQRIKKICAHCGDLFIAQKATTRFCSLPCAQRNYKLRAKEEKQKQNHEANAELLDTGNKPRQERPVADRPVVAQELIDVKTLAAITSLSERTLFRLMKDETFPRLKVGRSLLFHKQTVLDYIIHKYGNL